MASELNQPKQLFDQIMLLSPQSQPQSLSNYRISRSQLKRSINRFKKEKRNKDKQQQLRNPLLINTIQPQQNYQNSQHFQFSSFVDAANVVDHPEEYLKLNKLLRATNELLPLHQSHSKKPPTYLVFTPEQRFIVLLNLATIVVTYVYFTEIPITIAFENHREQAQTSKAFTILNMPALMIFFFGALIKARTAYFQYGILITDTKLIAINYFRKSFLIDLFSIGSVIVYEFSQIFRNGPIAYRFIILLFYLKVSQLIEMEKAVIQLYDMNRRVKASLKLFLLLTKIFMLCNIVACGFFYISDNLCKQGGIYQNCHQCCWIKSVKFNQKPIREYEWSVQYSYSIYWASTTMISIGYGDITPQNRYEISYVVGVQFTSCLVFAYSLNQIWGIIQQLNNKKLQIQHRISIMNTYMRDKKITNTLKSKIKAYLLHFYHTKNVREKQLEKDIISDLTPSLKTQLFYESYGFIFRGHNFFKKYLFSNQSFSSDLLQISSQKIIQSGYFEEQIIFCPEIQPGHNMLFYIQQGEVENYIQLKKNRISVRKIYLDETVGLPEFITQLNYKNTLKAIKYSVVYTLNYQDWKYCLMEEDQDYEAFFSIKEKLIFENAYHQVDVICQFCRKNDHATENCFQSEINSFTEKFLKRYKLKTERRPIKRENTQSSNITNNISAIRNNLSAIQSSIIKNHEIFKKSPLKHRKISMDSYILNKRQDPFGIHKQKKIIHKNQKIHNEIVKQLKTKIQVDLEGQDFEDLYSEDSQMLSTDNMVDKVQIFDWYFPKFNADQEIKNQHPRKRINLFKIF